MTKKVNESYVNATLKFCVVGFFIPGATIYVIIGSQLGISKLGIDCSNSWVVLWILTTLGAVISPFVFVKLMYKKLSTGFNFTNDKLWIFNLIEFTCLQCVFGTVFTNGPVLCYGNGGQNGIEFIFTGWLALPILLFISVILERLRVDRIALIKAKRMGDSDISGRVD